MVFAPKLLYEKDASVSIDETAVSLGMEGTARAGHFRGVATVVVKLCQLGATDRRSVRRKRLAASCAHPPRDT